MLLAGEGLLSIHFSESIASPISYLYLSSCLDGALVIWVTHPESASRNENAEAQA